jgi:hypothetical protein
MHPVWGTESGFNQANLTDPEHATERSFTPDGVFEVKCGGELQNPLEGISPVLVFPSGVKIEPVSSEEPVIVREHER